MIELREKIVGIIKEFKFVGGNSFTVTDMILTLIREEIEKVENPYHEEVMDEAYNIYPEFGTYEECRQAILKALEAE